MKKEKGFTFKWALLIYTILLGAVIAVIAVFVWNGLEKYQAAYNEAKAGGDPQIYAEELINSWNYETVLGYVEEYGAANIGNYNTSGQIAEYFTTLLGEITYKENEKYTNAMPVYDILAGDTRIAVVSFKAEGNNDEFGFHKWQIRDFAFDTDSVDTMEYSILALNDYIITVNGTELIRDDVSEDSYFITTVEDAVSLKAKELSGSVIEYVTYDLGNCLVKPEITVKDIDGNEITECVEDEGKISYISTASENFTESVKTRVIDTCHAYIMNIYNKLSFYQMSKYLAAGSDAYAVVLDVQNSITWGWHPDTVEIIEESVSDYIKYSDTLFSCKYYGKIYKADEDEEYEEIFNYNLLFQKSGEEWYLTYFVLE